MGRASLFKFWVKALLPLILSLQRNHQFHHENCKQMSQSRHCQYFLDHQRILCKSVKERRLQCLNDVYFEHIFSLAFVLIILAVVIRKVSLPDLSTHQKSSYESSEINQQDVNDRCKLFRCSRIPH